MKDELRSQIQKIGTGSFLFMGSGVSRRYLSLPTWADLLRQFARCGKDFGYYKSLADGSLPRAASFLAEDFHALWWKDDDYKACREATTDLINQKSDPLKYVIADFIKANTTLGTSPDLKAELDLLRSSCVDGIITTNWDNLFETLFPDYRVFIGQDELLFNVPSMIAEIYKIHGCCSKFPSLILTQEDYAGFHERNPYLASKLLTMFLENPIIFMGYSLTDPNICAILESVIKCMGTNDLNRLQDRLIFVEWNAETTTPTIGSGILRLNSPSPLPITTVKTASFVPVFEALQDNQRKIPLRVLRYCKEQLYEFVKTGVPQEHLCILPMDEATKMEDVEFVVGVGATDAAAMGKGYTMITRRDLIIDYMLESPKLDPKALLEKSFPYFMKTSSFTPIFKYLHLLGIKTKRQFNESGLLDGNLPSFAFNHDSYKTLIPKIKGIPFKDLLVIYDENRILQYIPTLVENGTDPGEILAYLATQLKHFDSNQNSKTYLCKAICACDQKLYILE